MKLIFIFLFLFTVSAQSLEIPKLTGPVVDEAKILSPKIEKKLALILKKIWQEHKVQIQILTLKTIEGLPIEQVSIKIVDEWALGTKEGDKGVLLIIAEKEHRIRIEVGQGLEGDIPDAYAKRIIDETMTPLFRAGDINTGITLGVYQIASLALPGVNVEELFNSEELNLARSSEKESGFKIIFIIIFILISVGEGAIRGRFMKHRGIGGLGGSGRFGGGFGGSSRGGIGGGWSGRGGGFSGGGASGGW